jgi:hypothetical protein
MTELASTDEGGEIADTQTPGLFVQTLALITPKAHAQVSYADPLCQNYVDLQTIINPSKVKDLASSDGKVVKTVGNGTGPDDFLSCRRAYYDASNGILVVYSALRAEKYLNKFNGQEINKRTGFAVGRNVNSTSLQSVCTNMVNSGITGSQRAYPIKQVASGATKCTQPSDSTIISADRIMGITDGKEVVTGS